MKANIKRVIGKAMSVVGFFALFVVAEDSIALQAIWSASAMAILLLGYKLVEE